MSDGPTSLPLSTVVTTSVGGALTIAALCAVIAVLVLRETTVGRLELENQEHLRENARQRLVIALLDQEMGRRGMATAGDRTFLEAYQRGVREEADAWSALHATLAGSAEATRSLARLRAAVDAWHEHLTVPPLSEARAAPVGRPPWTSLEGDPRFAGIRAALDAVADEQAALARARRAELERHGRRALWAGAALCASLIAAGALLLVWGRRRVAMPLKLLARQVESGERIEPPAAPSAIREISALRVALARSRDNALRDPLTHAYNRRFLVEVLPKLVHQTARTRTPLSALMVDVDRFKDFNDRHGHDAGDRVLAAVARSLSEQTRVSDTLVRYGGEEFAILLPNTSLQSALAIAERAREAVEATRTAIPQAERPLSVTISIGVSTLPEHGATADDLLLAADKALFRAKDAGRNRVVAAAASGMPGATTLALAAAGE